MALSASGTRLNTVKRLATNAAANSPHFWSPMGELGQNSSAGSASRIRTLRSESAHEIGSAKVGCLLTLPLYRPRRITAAPPLRHLHRFSGSDAHGFHKPREAKPLQTAN